MEYNKSRLSNQVGKPPICKTNRGMRGDAKKTKNNTGLYTFFKDMTQGTL